MKDTDLNISEEKRKLRDNRKKCNKNINKNIINILHS